jgi:hypothetical protein
MYLNALLNADNYVFGRKLFAFRDACFYCMDMRDATELTALHRAPELMK